MDDEFDIEDLAEEAGGESTLNPRLTKKREALVFPVSTFNESKHRDDVDEQTDIVPGTQKVWIKTYGCSHNVSDSEYMEGILSNYGYRITEEKEVADIWLINSCTVKDPSQAAFMHLVNKAKEIKKPVVVAGCVPQADRSITGLDDVTVVGIQQIDRVVEAVEQTLQGNVVKMLAKKDLPRLDLPKIRKNKLVEIIPLSTGCLGSCTYCKTKHARGKLGSYSLQTIIDRVITVVNDGVTEIWLSSEDTGAYGLDIGSNIAELLQKIVEVLPMDGPMLRIGMTNPPYMLAHLEAISEILRHPKVFSFLHIPVQSASNSVLKAMNREYTVEEFRTVADYLLTHVPEMTIATDIICGFPNETESDFESTLQLIDTFKFAIVNISQFYPRPGTPAAKMKRIRTQDVKDRSRRLTRLFESYDPYSYMIGQCYEVWFNTEISEDEKHNVGHTKNYVKVLLPRDDALLGSHQIVLVTSAHRFHVEGKMMTKENQFMSVLSSFYYKYFGRIYESIYDKNRMATSYYNSQYKVLSAVTVVGIAAAITISTIMSYRRSLKLL